MPPNVVIQYASSQILQVVSPRSGEGLRNCLRDDHDRMLESGCNRKRLIDLFPEVSFRNTYEIEGAVVYVGTVGLTVDSRKRSDEGAR